MQFVSKLFHWDFLRQESAGGIVMLGAAFLAFALANSPASATYHAIITYPLLKDFTFELFNKDVLMALFFLLVGMELKYEMLQGSLSAKGQKLLPLFAAVGGVVTPACIYLAITAASPHLYPGWAIPTATDIAFALCVLRLAGPTVPHAAKMFLLALAIFDDLAAILIIAFVYTTAIELTSLIAVAAILIGFIGMQRLDILHTGAYLCLGVLLWFALSHAGVHPTVAGVITGLAIPLKGDDGGTPLATLMHRLHPFVAFIVLPLFAFTSAGLDLRSIEISGTSLTLPLGIATALIFGKPIGIMATAWFATQTGLAKAPDSVSLSDLWPIAILAGTGFTMSLFIGELALPDPLQSQVKLGVFAGSLLAALLGIVMLRSRIK